MEIEKQTINIDWNNPILLDNHFKVIVLSNQYNNS